MTRNILKTIVCTIILIGLGICFFDFFSSMYVSSVNTYIDTDYTIDSMKNDYLREPLNFYLLDTDTLTNNYDNIIN